MQQILKHNPYALLLGLSTMLMLSRKSRLAAHKSLVRISLLLLSVLLNTARSVVRFKSQWTFPTPCSSSPDDYIEPKDLADTDFFQEVITKLHESGLRSTGSKAHEQFIAWVEQRLADLSGVQVTRDEFDILRWQTLDGQSLHDAGSLNVTQENKQQVNIDIAGVVPFSLPTEGQSGQLVYVPQGTPLTAAHFRNRTILRDLPDKSVMVALTSLPSYYLTNDLRFDTRSYNRPSFWEHPMHIDLLDAGKAGAAGIIFLADLPRAQMRSYWDPHQGCHYHVPGVICAVEDAQWLRDAALHNAEATITVEAEVSKVTTRNVIATLPGRSTESIVYATHTDGNTCVQDNGVAALLALAQYFSRQPLSARGRTLQFAFNTAHLHVSREGSGRHAEQLDITYDRDDEVTLVIPVEHLGTRELEAKAMTTGHGRVLEYTGRGETMIWCVGPSKSLVAAIEAIVRRRGLDRVMITRGIGQPRRSLVPTYSSFGGLGTLYHNHLLPTTSLISGPWSLFAPSFGIGAIDVNRLRLQTLALGDIYSAVDGLSRMQIAGEYGNYRQRRAEDTTVYDGFKYPPETVA